MPMNFRPYPIVPANLLRPGAKRIYSTEKTPQPNGRKPDPKETVSVEELLLSNVYTQEALINLLEEKGVIRKADLLEEIKRLRDKKKS